MPKTKNKPSYNFEQYMRCLRKETPEFDLDSINAKMRKDQPKSKRQFMRKLFLLEEKKVISGLTNTEIAGIVSCNEPLVSKARNNRLATKSLRKKSMTLDSSEEEEVCEEIKQQYEDGKIVSPQTLRRIVEQKAGHSVGHSFHQSFLDRHENVLEMQIAKKRDEKRMKVKKYKIFVAIQKFLKFGYWAQFVHSFCNLKKLGTKCITILVHNQQLFRKVRL
ncbi:MAG: hypothetical protein EZS28_010523 [Streblomastix strix]|uniref:Uncharacterized protein n=1 Tax=Streblomastix strix TaxID=222440 RepID=A0A5J4WGC4_9EUKA|nr:MAG: hypothetical protein EZS28_010523 [Streblomastix strix]